MIKQEYQEFSANRCGGTGTIAVSRFLDSEDMHGKGRGATKLVLPAGASIGIHQHSDSVEQYYVLSGSGIFHDNGIDKPISAGQTGVMEPGGYHGMANTGTEDLVVIAVHLFV